MQEPQTVSRINIVDRVLSSTGRVADRNRSRFWETGVFVVDLLGSPGAGKTSLIEATIGRIEDGTRVAVVTGDMATYRDAERISRLGVHAVQVVTGDLDRANLVDAAALREAVGHLDLIDIDVLFVEHVGGLVSPAFLDIGQNARVVALSVTEGEDKPLKYPQAFRGANVVALTKTDLLPHAGVSIDVIRGNVRRINPHADIVELSCVSQEGLDAWLDWVECPTSAIPLCRWPRASGAY